jgi:hypothetical protein
MASKKKADPKRAEATSAYDEPANFLEIDVVEPQTKGWFALL